MQPQIKLIACLGNPGSKYQQDRHNVGHWFANSLLESVGNTLEYDKKSGCHTAKVNINNNTYVVLLPDDYMNLSGNSIQKYLNYFNIATKDILVVHDDLDIPVGEARLKVGGGHGGHNGLRDIIQKLDNSFSRLRLGIGHPGASNMVADYVLSKPSKAEQQSIMAVIDKCLSLLPEILTSWQNATQKLHSNK